MPNFLLSFRVSTLRFREQNIRRPDENACTAGYQRPGSDAELFSRCNFKAGKFPFFHKCIHSIWDRHLRFFLVSGIVGNGKLPRPSRIISIPDI